MPSGIQYQRISRDETMKTRPFTETRIAQNHEKRFGQASSGQSTQCPGKEAIQPHQLCHRSVLDKPSKFRRTFLHLCSCLFKLSLSFCNCCRKLTYFDLKNPEIQQCYRKLSKSPRSPMFFRFRNEYF